MHYLIDGHNLIAHLPDIDLEDPNDEVKLVLVLRSWVAAGRGRQATIYFDGGLPGGRQADLSGGGIEVVFAPAGSQADGLLIRQIKQARNPREHTLVTSDRQIITSARQQHMPVLSAEAFAGRLAEEREKRQKTAQPDVGDDPTITAGEVSEWLELFGPVPEIPSRRKRTPPAKQQPDRPEEKRPAGELKTEGTLSTEDVAAWLDLFGGEPKTPTPSQPQPTKKKKGKQETARDPKKEGALSDEDLAVWLEWFGSENS